MKNLIDEYINSQIKIIVEHYEKYQKQFYNDLMSSAPFDNYYDFYKVLDRHDFVLEYIEHYYIPIEKNQLKKELLISRIKSTITTELTDFISDKDILDIHIDGNSIVGSYKENNEKRTFTLTPNKEYKIDTFYFDIDVK